LARDIKLRLSVIVDLRQPSFPVYAQAMTTRVSDDIDQSPLESTQSLAAHLASGCKPKSAWRLGTEHEKFVYHLSDFRAPDYAAPNGIQSLLEGLTRYGWERVLEGGQVIALKKGLASISLEPAGQFELSGAPLIDVHATAAELDEHLQECLTIGKQLGLGFMGHGFNPLWAREDMPVMPKGRYNIMRRYMPKVGTLGLDMMLRTCTVQVNLDYADEADMVKKFRVSLALQPLATALFANSPFKERVPNGFLSYRSHIWTDTDADRTGMLPFVFEQGFGFERYADYMAQVPMYFVYRDGRYIDCAGLSFQDFMAGKLAALPGERPTLEDCKDHLSTAFPEVRLKTFLEMRGADCGPRDMVCALPAFWVGLLYTQSALDAAWDEVKDWTHADHAALRRDVPRLGLNTQVRGESLFSLAARILKIAQAGLEARGVYNPHGQSEALYLEPLQQIIASKQTHAEALLHAYHTRWHGDIMQIYAQESYV
jgi:glutamate--cysteine ligase